MKQAVKFIIYIFFFMKEKGNITVNFLSINISIKKTSKLTNISSGLRLTVGHKKDCALLVFCVCFKRAQFRFVLVK